MEKLIYCLALIIRWSSIQHNALIKLKKFAGDKFNLAYFGASNLRSKYIKCNLIIVWGLGYELLPVKLYIWRVSNQRPLSYIICLFYVRPSDFLQSIYGQTGFQTNGLSVTSSAFLRPTIRLLAVYLWSDGISMGYQSWH